MSRISFHMTTDRYARDVERENPAKDEVIDGSTSRIGSIQWHPEREPRFITAGLEAFTLNELDDICAQLRREMRRDVRSRRRIDIKAILSDPVKRRRLMIQALIATQEREGITTTWEQAEAAYDKVQKELGRL